MKNHMKTAVGIVATSICMSLVAAQAAQAVDFTAVDSDWHIVLDSFRDGTDGSINGIGSPSQYEMFGMAIKADQDTISIAINANIPLLGNTNQHASDNNIGYGDLFFNFSGQSFKDASAANQLFGIRFAGTNDSGVEALGVYGDVKAQSVIAENSGWESFSDYQNWVEGDNRDQTPGATGEMRGEVSFGDLSAAEAKDYIGNTTIQNVMASGNLLGGITMLSDDELAGLDFGTGNSSVYSLAHTFGFSFDRNLLPDGDALISLLAECANDGMAMAMRFEPNETSPASVPEPTTVTSLALVGLALAGSKIKRKNQR